MANEDIIFTTIFSDVTRMLPELRGLSYAEILKALGKTALETRRLRGDFDRSVQDLKGFVNIDIKIFFQEALGNRWGG